MSIEWIESWSQDEGAQRVTAAFRELFGVAPAGVWSAPGRVNLIGEHTDYNGGLCLPLALPHRTYAAVRLRSDGDGLAPGTIRLASAQEPAAAATVDLAQVGPGTVQGWPAYVAGVAWALQQDGHEVGGFDAVIDSCVPYGSGLSSSAALESAVAVALDDLFGLGLGDDAGRARLVTVCVRAENEIAGAPTGGMDQSASLRCRAGHALHLDCRDGSTEQIPFDLEAHGLALLVIDTRAEHHHADGQYAARRTTCEQAAERLGVATLRDVADLEAALAELADDDVARRRVRHVVTENARVELVESLLAADQPEQVGAVLTAGHASLRDDYEVSCAELDVAVDTAVLAGALGARMVGGGFGGSAIALVRSQDVPAVAEQVADAFDHRGFRSPAFLVAVASAPAGRS